MLKWVKEVYKKDNKQTCDGCGKDVMTMYFLHADFASSDIGLCRICAKKLITGKLILYDYGISL